MTHRTRVTLALGLVVGLAGGEAPAAEPVEFTVGQALVRALDTGDVVDAAEAGVRGADGSRWSARSGWLPSVSASLAYQRTLATPFDDLLSGFGAPTGTGSGTATGSESVTLPFGQPNTWNASLLISQPLFVGGRTWASVKVAGLGHEVAVLALEGARAGTALTTVTAYYDALLSDRLLEIATGTQSQAQLTADRTALSREVGRQPEFDVLQAQVAVANQAASVLSAARQRDIAYAILRQLLDVPEAVPLVLTSSLDDAGVAATAADLAEASSPQGTRAGVRQLEALTEQSRAGVRLAVAPALPSLVASASIGQVSYPTSLWPLGKDRTWYGNSTASVVLTIPLLNGGRVYGDARRARAVWSQSQSRLEQGREADSLDRLSARGVFESAAAQTAAASEAAALAERAYGIAELRFAEGVSTQLELADARLQLERAHVNRAQSQRDMAVARTRLALIGSLPLSSP